MYIRRRPRQGYRRLRLQVRMRRPISGREQKENPAVSASQSDLFDTVRLPGLAQAENIVTRDEEQALIRAIDAVELSPFRFHQWTGKRLTAAFGWSYDFETGRLAPSTPIPDWVLPLRERAGRFARLPAEELVQVLLIRYDFGAGIGWHRDRPVFEHVIGISLGAPATMRFRRRRGGGFERAAADLPARSIYHLSGEARHQWEHSIAEMEMTRWSITFRSLSANGRAYESAAP
jgi:DNA oxidative demethylase